MWGGGEGLSFLRETVAHVMTPTLFFFLGVFFLNSSFERHHPPKRITCTCTLHYVLTKKKADNSLACPNAAHKACGVSPHPGISTRETPDPIPTRLSHLPSRDVV